MSLDRARDNFAGLLLEWVEHPTPRTTNQLTVAAHRYTRALEEV